MTFVCRRAAGVGRVGVDGTVKRPTSVFEPPASLAACARCQEAYAEARKVIEDAGGIANGIAKWMEWVSRP